MALDKEFFEGYTGDISRNQITKLRKEAGIYTTETFFEDLIVAFNKQGFKGLEFKVIDREKVTKIQGLLKYITQILFLNPQNMFYQECK